MIGDDIIARDYMALKKMITQDYPYEIILDDNFYYIFFQIYRKILSEHSAIQNKFYSDNGQGIINLIYLDHYLILCYRLSNYLYKNNSLELANAIYYSSKLRCSTDLFYTTEIGPYFIPVHSLGTIIDSHATYGYLFKIYNEVHIGPYNIIGKDPSHWEHPVFGNGVTLLSKVSIFGKTIIGNNVIVSSGAVIINEIIPDDCIVIGQSPNLYFMPLKEKNTNLI